MALSLKPLRRAQSIILYLLLAIFNNAIGRAQTYPLPVEAAIRQFIGGKSLSCQADYTCEYAGVQTPITFKMFYVNSSLAARFEIDLASGSSFSQEIGKQMARFGADKPIALSARASSKYYTLWPNLKTYCEVFVPEEQQAFFQDNLKWSKKEMGSEKVDGIECVEYEIICSLEKQTNEEAVVWISKSPPELPVKIEMETDDFTGHRQKATVLFSNWKAETEESAKFLVPSDYRKIRDIRDILPSDYANQQPETRGATVSTSSRAEALKRFLASSPTIAELIFKRIGVMDGKTNVYFGKKQSNAFLFREINSVGEADAIKQDPMNLIVGRYGSNTWAIRSAMLFTTTDELSRPERGATPDTMGLMEHLGYSILSEPLKLGVLFAELNTFKWNGNDFIAEEKDGNQLSGRLLLNDSGVPERILYKRKGVQVTYEVDYKYRPEAASNDLPSEMDLTFANDAPYSDSIKAKPYKQYFILKLRTSAALLSESEFASEQYRANIRSGGEIIYSNRQALVLINGMPQPVPKSGAVAHGLAAFEIRYITLALMLIPIVVFVAVLKMKTPINHGSERKPKA